MQNWWKDRLITLQAIMTDHEGQQIKALVTSWRIIISWWWGDGWYRLQTWWYFPLQTMLSLTVFQGY